MSGVCCSSAAVCWLASSIATRAPRKSSVMLLPSLLSSSPRDCVKLAGPPTN